MQGILSTLSGVAIRLDGKKTVKKFSGILKWQLSIAEEGLHAYILVQRELIGKVGGKELILDMISVRMVDGMQL